MTQQVQSNKEANLSKQVAELQGRVQSLEQLLHQGKDVLTLEEAAKFMGIARSSLYKMTHEQTIPFYKPNGKMIFFEKSDLLAWVRKNRVSSEAEISEEAERINSCIINLQIRNLQIFKSSNFQIFKSSNLTSLRLPVCASSQT